MPKHEQHDEHGHALIIYRDGDTFEIGTEDGAGSGCKKRFVGRVWRDGKVRMFAFVDSAPSWNDSEPYVYINTEAEPPQFRSGQHTPHGVAVLFAWLQGQQAPARPPQSQVDALIEELGRAALAALVVFSCFVAVVACFAVIPPPWGARLSAIPVGIGLGYMCAPLFRRLRRRFAR